MTRLVVCPQNHRWEWTAELAAPGSGSPPACPVCGAPGSPLPLQPDDSPLFDNSAQRTSVSLLERVRQPYDQPAWDRFVKLYTPLLFFWARRAGLQDQDAADLVQDVLTVLVERLPEFTYDRQRSFRGWLRTVLLNKWHNRRRQRATQTLGAEEGPAASDPAEVFAEAEYRQYLIGRALELMQTDFQPTTWKAFWECQVHGRPGAEVAAELGLTVGAVYVAKSRVLNRLREELAGLLD